MSAALDLTALDAVSTTGVAYQPPKTGSVGRLYLIVFLGIFGAFALPFIGIVQGFIDAAGGDGEAMPWPVLRILFILAMVVPLAYLIALIVRGFRAGSDLTAKLPAFAAANGFTLETRVDGVTLPGAIFRTPYPSWVFQRLTRPAGDLEIGNVVLQMPSGRLTPVSPSMRVMDTWGYVTLPAPASLPHVLLESVSSGRGTPAELPLEVDAGQRLDVRDDPRFALYAPAEFVADAELLFTPELLALLDDGTTGWHIEIVEGRLFVFSPDDFVTGADAAVYRRISAIVDVLRRGLGQVAGDYSTDTPAAVFPGAEAAVVAPAFAPAGQVTAPVTRQYGNLTMISLAVIGGIILLFIVGVFVAMGIVFAVYGPPTVPVS
jgi:hypothetical protein